MGNFINELKASGNISYLIDFRRGTLLDISGNANNCVAGAGTPSWIRYNGMSGIYCQDKSASYLKINAAASNNINTGTIFFAGKSFGSSFSNTFCGAMGKPLAWALLAQTTFSNWGLYDYAGGAFRSFGITVNQGNNLHFIASNFQSGIVNGSQGFVNGNAGNMYTMTVSSQVNAIKIGMPDANNQEFNGPIYMVGMFNRILTSSEHSRLYEEFLLEGNSIDAPRKNFVQVPNGMTDAEYNAKGIVLDTNFSTMMVAGTKKIIDRGPNNYAGSITAGAPTSAADGAGMVFQQVDRYSLGDITQLNSTTKFTISGWFETPSGTILNGSYWIYREKDASNAMDVYTTGGTSANPSINFLLYTVAGNTYATCSAAIRAGAKHHICWVYNGNGATNTDKMQVYIDGVARTLTFTGTIPAIAPNLAGYNFQQINFTMTNYGMKIFNVPLTANDVRQEYLLQAKKILFKDTFEDVPVSLAAASAGQYIGNWRVLSGTWKCSEDGYGRRWLECVTAGTVAIPKTEVYGTWLLSFFHTSSSNMHIMLSASLPAAWNVAGQNGYDLYISATEQIVIQSIINGVASNLLMYTASGYLSSSTLYQLAITRRPSDGRFTEYVIKGGSIITPIMAVPSGGFNPSLSNVEVTSSSWLTITAGIGDKICLYDPSDKRSGIVHYQGQLDPISGEL